MIIRALFCIAIWAPIGCFGQLKQLARFENTQKSSDEVYMVISMKEKGVALFRALNKYEGGQRIWEIILLDTDLKEVWKNELLIETKFNFSGYEYIDSHLYFLYRMGETDLSDINIVKIDTETHEISRTNIEHNIKYKLTHFNVSNDNVILGGYLNSEPVIILYNLLENQLKVLPGVFVTNTELLDLRTNLNGTVNAITIERGARDNKRLVFKTFTTKGETLLEDNIIIPSDKTILSGVTSSLIRDELIIVGSYSIGNSKLSSGIYSIMVDPFRDQPIRFTDFSQFENFFNYLSPKKAKKIKAKAEHDRLSGRTPSYKTNLIPIKVEETTEGFVFLAEVYRATGQDSSPTNTSINNPYFSPFGYGYSPFSYGPYSNRYYNQPYSPNYNSPRSGNIHVIEAVLVQFSPDGKLDWDESLELVDIKLDFIEQSSDFTPSTMPFIAYKNEDKVFYRQIEQDVNALDTLSIRGAEELDIVRNDSDGEGALRYWFDEYFYVWGFQNIRNYSIEDKNRLVFYIIKVGVE